MPYQKRIEKPKEISGCASGLIIALITIVFWCGLAIWLPQFFNNQRLKSFAENLYKYPLPPDTTVIDKYTVLRPANQFAG
jgi:hypothetical protein